jgi:hypothetical protein
MICADGTEHGRDQLPALRRVRLRGTLRSRSRRSRSSSGQSSKAQRTGPSHRTNAGTSPASADGPQWQTIKRVTVAEVFRATGDEAAASQALLQSIATAESTRLPHQIQRAMRAARGALPEIEEAGAATLQRLNLTLSAA